MSSFIILYLKCFRHPKIPPYFSQPVKHSCNQHLKLMVYYLHNSCATFDFCSNWKREKLHDCKIPCIHFALFTKYLPGAVTLQRPILSSFTIPKVPSTAVEGINNQKKAKHPFGNSCFYSTSSSCCTSSTQLKASAMRMLVNRNRWHNSLATVLSCVGPGNRIVTNGSNMLQIQYLPTIL